MFSSLYVDGPVGLADEDPETVTLEFTGASEYRCRNCGEDLVETVDGIASESGDACPDEDDGEHEPERVPLSWCNSAAIQVDESDDSVTVSISVGDPRGAFTFTVRRVPDDATGKLVMHVPYPLQPSPHMTLNPLHEGTYLVG